MPRKIRKIEPSIPLALVKKRVAAYARVSSGKDGMLHSLAAQISYYSDLIQREPGWEYAGVYADEAMTGTKDNRAEFQRLLTDCRSDKVDMVITKSISRFARNTVTMLEVLRELKNYGVDVYFEKENIHSMSGDGELMLTILASFAQEESLSVSENCKWRIRKRFADGELVNLRFMFGYQIHKGEITIEPEQAEIVRRIFTDYLAGMGCTLIANKLREQGVQRLRGGIWNSERVAEILKNEKYTGNALLQKKYVTDHLSKALVLNKGVLPKYYAVGTHPPIIDELTFQRAQELMDENRARNAGKKQAGRYPFSSKLVCGQCGKNYKRRTTRGRVYWSCSTYLKYGKSSCSAKQIPDSILQAIVTEVLGLSEFDELAFSQQVKELRTQEPDLLVLAFRDGRTVQREWHNRSRHEGWTEEARQEARYRQLEYWERRNAACEPQGK